MDPATIISTAIPLAEAALRAIAAFHAGDMPAAEAALRDARKRFDAGSAAWDAAGTVKREE